MDQAKSSTVESRARRRKGVRACIYSMIDGEAEHEIVHAMQERFGVSQSTAYSWYKEARRSMQPQTEKEKNEMRSMIMARTLERVTKAEDAGDFAAANGATKIAVDTFGLKNSPDTSVTLVQNNNILVHKSHARNDSLLESTRKAGLNDEQVRALLNAGITDE
jgi:transposase